MLLLAALAHAADPVAAHPVEPLSFFAGRWEGRDGTETWALTPSGLVGVGFAGGGFEVLLVKEWEGKLGYVAFPGGAAPTVFHVESVDGETARFSNPAHDDPQVITYRRRGDKMCAEVGTLADPDRDRIRWRLGDDARVEALEAADRAFAADVAAAAGAGGAAAAWVSWFDPAGWSWNTRTGKVPAGEAMLADIAPTFADGALLAWAPTGSGLSPDGQLGFTVGTWRWTGAGSVAEPERTARSSAAVEQVTLVASGDGGGRVEAPRRPGADDNGASDAEEGRAETGAPAPIGEGGYVSVWRRQPDGSWKVLFDTST